MRLSDLTELVVKPTLNSFLQNITLPTFFSGKLDVTSDRAQIQPVGKRSC